MTRKARPKKTRTIVKEVPPLEVARALSIAANIPGNRPPSRGAFVELDGWVGDLLRQQLQHTPQFRLAIDACQSAFADLAAIVGEAAATELWQSVPPRTRGAPKGNRDLAWDKLLFDRYDALRAENPKWTKAKTIAELKKIFGADDGSAAIERHLERRARERHQQ
jgi:hypothetical protein